MKAFTRYSYGGPEVLQLEEVEKPILKEDHILVKVIANSANPADWRILRGEPILARFAFGLFKPKSKFIGADFAGVVVETGSDVTKFQVGDRVFGETLSGGAFAEYISVSESVCAIMPEQTGFPEMAAVPIAGLTALQALITHGKLKEGESVLINGASGGVGHFAVQIAKAYGAKVTGVCSSRNIDFVKSMGTDFVIAYDKEDIHKLDGEYDLVVDTNGNLSHQDYKRLGRRGVVVGLTTMRSMIWILLRKALSSYPLYQFTAEANTKDLQTLALLISKGQVHPHIESSYSYNDIPAAISYIEAMRTRGKVVMIWDQIANQSTLNKQFEVSTI